MTTKLSSSCRAAASSSLGMRSRGTCIRRHPQTPLLFLLVITAAFLLSLSGIHGHFVVSVRAAPSDSGREQNQGTDASFIHNPEHVFGNVEELNHYFFGAPHTFKRVESTQLSDAVAGAAVAATSHNNNVYNEQSPTFVNAREVRSALATYATTAGNALTFPDSVVDGAQTSTSRVEFPSGGASGGNENVSAASMCAADFTCPRSSVAWASGSFTSAGLLTPHSLGLPAGLQLTLSLCCRYRFDGTLLRSAELYDTFLQELLQASPFQVLSPLEKRELFPQQKVYIVDTWGRRRAYNTSYALTAEDVATHNDADGDVLVLTTGVLRQASLQKVLSSSPTLASVSSRAVRDSQSGNANVGTSDDDAAGANGGDTEAVGSFASTDMQLRITNRVLKCKCPHILTVMPLLHVRRDTLPPIQIAGLGAHCGVTPTQRRAEQRATTRPRIRRVRRPDGSVGFAASFELVPRLPPTTFVVWTVRQVEEVHGGKGGATSARGEESSHQQQQQQQKVGSAVVLRHVRFLPVVMNASGRVQYSAAASPFFLMEPNERYEIAATVMRGPLLSEAQSALMSSSSSSGTAVGSPHTHAAGSETVGEDGAPHPSATSVDEKMSSWAVDSQRWQHLRLQRSARGRFVLRLPLNRTWALPPVHPAPHFGFRRSVRLQNSTLSHTEVRLALDPHYDPASKNTSQGGEAASPEAEKPNNGGSWFGLGRWTGSGTATTGTAAAARRNRTLSYYGYWENVPLTDQLLPQVAQRISSNPFLPITADFPVSETTIPLFLGRNVLAYVVRDVDDVCDPVTLEGREVWAVQSFIETPGPITACGEQTAVTALVLRELYARMRVEPRLDVTVPNTTWSAERHQVIEVAQEGRYSCDGLREQTGTAASRCVAVADTDRDGSGAFATLHMTQRGVYEVVWTVRAAVRGADLVVADNIDPLYARVLPIPGSNATFIVEVRSQPLLVVRRLASYPSLVKVELPMHARRWLVSAPAAGTSSSGTSARGQRDGSGAAVDVLLDKVPSGYWRSRLPIRVLSVDEQLTAELDTNDVPNVQRLLPDRTLEFVAQDRGERMTLTASVHGVRRSFAYTSRCPDTVVEYALHVVAFPPPAIVPAYAPIYTEEGCVVLLPPRAVRKDEVAEWHVPPCAAAAAGGRSPFLVERTLSVEEQEEHAYVTTAVDGGAPLPVASPHVHDTPSREGSAPTDGARAAPRRAVTALMACGVEVYQRCDVVWSVRNLVAETHKTYSLRRCQRPPAVLFHDDAQQQRVSYPQTGVFELPSVTETFYVPVNVTAAATAEKTDAAAVTNGDGSGTPTAVMVRQRRARQVIPIAGYQSTLGYSFNYTGVQDHFEMQLHPLSDEVAHQLTNTQHDYVASEDGVMVLRRRTSLHVQPSHASALHSAERSEDENARVNNAFWSEYEANHASAYAERHTAAGRDGASSSLHSADVAAEQQRSRQLDQVLGETYLILHETAARRLRVADVGNASLFPMNYVVRGSPAMRSAEAEEDHREFVRRGMCVERPGHIAVLAVNPLGSVKVDERYGTLLPAPPAPAVAVLPFCAPQYTFARYPELASVYGYDYTWTCPDAAVVTATKYHPTYTVLAHTPELRGGSGDVAGSTNATLCELRVENHLTRTERRDWFYVRRVFPHPLPATALVVLSDNAASSLQILPAAPRARGPRSAATNSAAAAAANRRNTNGNNGISAATVVTMEELYTSPPNRYSFTRARRVVGKSVVLHVDAPSVPAAAQWAVTSIVPAASTTVGTQVLMAEVEFQALPRHPAALARRRGGSTVVVKGLHTPGIYTLTHTLPDPENPSVCPPVTLTEMLDVFHARVLEKELFVCGDTAALQAVPIPREIAHEFVGQWEVVSHATDAKTVWTAGANFTGIRFERGTRAETFVHGLPFGVVTMRWAIYRLLPPSLSDAPAGGQRVLVDYDTVEVFVLTENLPSHRLVTLADQATLLTTSSTQNWVLEDANGDFTATGTNGMAGEGLMAAQVRMTHSLVSNYSQGVSHAFAEAMQQDEASRNLFRTYYGLQPRPGTGALTLHHLPVGTVHLRYNLVPSQSLFGRMVGHTCALQGHYEVERVSAFLTATTTMDHECDGYTGEGRITLCLHTEAAKRTATTTSATKAAGSSRSASRAGRTATKPPLTTDAHFWQSQVRLIDPALLEETVKRGAREVEHQSRGRCTTPWWVAPTTQWSSPAYTTADKSASASSAASADEVSGTTTLPGRCVTFTVKAGRHLSPREVSQPLFVAVPRPSATPSSSSPSSSLGHFGGGLSSADRGAHGSSVGGGGGCPYQGDFISSRIIDGSPLVEGGTVLRTSSTTSASPSSSAAASSSSFFSFSQLFQLGLPHTAGGRNDDDSSSSSGGSGAWGIHFLPVLQPATLRRVDVAMRPMVGLRGVVDDVTSELNISGAGRHYHHSADGGAELVGDREGGATVLLRLDLTNVRHLGGYIVHSTSENNTSRHDATTTSSSAAYKSLLYKCVEGTVRGAEVLQYWTETNRPDGRVDRTAQEWLDYAFAVRDAPVPCDVLFASLDHLMAETYDPSSRAPQRQPYRSGSAASAEAETSASSSSSRGGWYSYGQRARRPVSTTTTTSPHAGPSSSFSTAPHATHGARYVSLTEMEQQVERIRKQYKWTADGIDVTGLSADLQNALSHRRITSAQLKAIEAARRARQAAEEAAREQEEAEQQHRTQRGLQNAPSLMSPLERLTTALRAYQGVADGSEVAVLRLRLPLHEAFAVPYDLFLRTALHKDVLCGTSVDPPPVMADPPLPPTIANPHALVSLGRLEVRDAVPQLSLHPPVVKQCEVEGGLPVLTFELSGASFQPGHYTAEDVVLEEIQNPALAMAGGALRDAEHPDIGLRACVAEMHRGLKAVVEAGSQKRLYLQLNACPFFKMLTPEEYNEHQDSAALLQRLQYSRYLRVTVRRAIRPDSFLSGRAVATVRSGQTVSSSSSSNSKSDATLIVTNTTVTPASTDATFIVEVRPTLARLHLRSSPHMEAPPPPLLPRSSSSLSSTTTLEPTPQHVDRAIADAGSTWWSRTVGPVSNANKHSDDGGSAGVDNSAAPRFAFTPTPARPLLVCESDLHRYGMQLGIELIGDEWTSPVGEEGSSVSYPPARGGWTGTTGAAAAALPRQRAPPNVALINSFSVVEHHSLDSSHHLYMKGGGVYRSHFINYLFSTLLSDPAVLQHHTFVHRYNRSFASIVLPPLSAVSAQRAAFRQGALTEFEDEEEDVDVLAALQQQQRHERLRHAPGTASGSIDRATVVPSVGAPAVRQFCKIEEILFAVPGIATQCRGCLLADTTFFVAGDLTGVWTPSSDGSAAGAVTADAAAAATPSSAPSASWTSETFTQPLLLPWDSAKAIPRQWTFDWACPTAAHQALEKLALHLSSRSDGPALYVVMDVVLYKLRGLQHGEELPAQQRPSVLLSSQPVALSEVLQQNRVFTRQATGLVASALRGGRSTQLAAPLQLSVAESTAGAAYTQLADDVLRHRRHARTMLDYFRDERHAGGVLVVNASVFLKVCGAAEGTTGGVVVGSGAACTVVSITDALLAVEPPLRTPSSSTTSWLRWIGGRGGSQRGETGRTTRTASPLSVAALAHHAFLTYLCFELLPLLGVVTVTTVRSRHRRGAEGGVGAGGSVTMSESFLQDQERAHLAYTVMAFIFLFCSYAYAPAVWTGLCFVIWSLSLYFSPRPELIFLFVASVLYMHFLL